MDDIFRAETAVTEKLSQYRRTKGQLVDLAAQQAKKMGFKVSEWVGDSEKKGGKMKLGGGVGGGGKSYR